MTKHRQSCNIEKAISLRNDWYPFKNQQKINTSINCFQIPMIFHTLYFCRYFVDNIIE